MTSTYLFAGGGTGGHIYPAMAIADELAAIDARARCVFVVSNRPLDTRILTGEGREFRVIPAAPLSLKPRELVRFFRSWGPSVRAGRALIQEAPVRAQTLVVAMGGFVAAPVVQSARAERCGAVLVNLDSVPGKANRWISGHVSRVFAVSGAPERPGWTIIPPIVRAAARATRPPTESRKGLGLDPDRPTLLVTGGSQGAGSINQLMLAFVRARSADLAGWQVLHQAGERFESDLRSAYADAGVPAQIVPFIREMGLAWGAADLVVTRGGAGAVAEVWANKVPAVFLPYPYHRDQHQRANCRALVESGGAVVVDDLVDPARTLAQAGPVLGGLLRDAGRLVAMRSGLASLGEADGSRRVAAALATVCAP